MNKSTHLWGTRVRMRVQERCGGLDGETRENTKTGDSVARRNAGESGDK